ncbi:IS200/IS605 family transposase [Urbifossiella limnaea]|uniref:Transposase IS200 like protein n=1 Tax=Urbifossiella limnaea TaxID=2528023 RepID=A0A517XL38_9BACT|nr:IS200/IS605 family transposase [Urbifossiella limnaea]QDU18227.1 Transposase IS200 like protein [Urbifossiella limnaea]
MPQSLSRVLVHLVFSTKNREPRITPAHRGRVFDYLGGALAALDCPPVRVGGMPDHVHLLFVLAKTVSVSKVVEEVKKESSKWAKQHVGPDFYWQSGYGAFSVSPSTVEAVRVYIENQEEHHQGRSFQDEFRGLLRRHDVEWDEQYVWD